MRSVLLGVAGILVVTASPARGDDREAAKKLSGEGLVLARGQDYVGAIAKFKAADALVPTAANDCNIALSYVKLERWARAELFVQRCKRNWVREKTKPLPSWVAKGHLDITASLEAGAYGRVEVTTTPADAAVHASAYEADEHIGAPVTLWLPIGTQSLRAVAPGHESQTTDVEVKKTTVAVAITLEPTKVAEPIKPVVKPPVEKEPETLGTGPLSGTQPRDSDATSAPRSRAIPLALTIAGGVLVAAAVPAHIYALRLKGDAEELVAGDAFDDKESSFKKARAVTIGLYAVGAATAAVGTVLLLRSGDSSSRRLGASVGPDGASVSVGWAFE